jgi:hypothetical protein
LHELGWRVSRRCIMENIEMEDKIALLLLQEFRSFRDTEFREFREDIASWRQNSGERLAKLESEVKSGVSGNGQPSRLAIVEDRVDALQRDRWFGAGVVAAISSGLTLGCGYALRMIFGR